MEREGFLRVNKNGEGEVYHTGTVGSSSPTRSVAVSSTPSASVCGGVNGGLNHIVHTVSKYDTLAGVAIKYGVEVADIKSLNGLVTDLQMFALKTIQIPLPGRHPPSPIVLNGHRTPPRPSSTQQTPSSRRHTDLFDSFSSLKLKSSSEQKVSPAMSRLQGYYGLGEADRNGAEGCEMTVFQKGRAHYLEDEPLPRSSVSSPPLNHHRKSKSTANCLEAENVSLIDQDLSQEVESNDSSKWIDKLVRRRQKSEMDFTSCPPEKLMKVENISGTAISAITGKGLALRPKSASRTVSLGVDGEPEGFNPIPVGLGDSFLTDDISGVRKSSSGSSLDSDNGALSSIWPTTKWNLKPDFQALSAAAITIPIFDGLPKPSNRRNKAAVD